MRWWNVSSWDIIGRLRNLEQKVRITMAKYTVLKEALDGIGADLAPIQSGINALNANLLALQDNPEDTAMLAASVSEASDLKTKFDALAAVFADHGSPVPVTANPTPLDPATGLPVEKPADPPADPAAPQA